MKTPILFFILLTFISTSKVETNIVEKVYCLLTNEEIKLYFVDLIETIKTKDVPKIIKALMEGYDILKNEIEKCWNNEPLLLSPAKKKLLYQKKKNELNVKKNAMEIAFILKNIWNISHVLKIVLKKIANNKFNVIF